MFASRDRDRDRDGEKILKIKRETRKFPRRMIHLQFQRSLSFFPCSGLISRRIARPRQIRPIFVHERATIHRERAGNNGEENRRTPGRAWA